MTIFRKAFGGAPSVARRQGAATLLAMLDQWWPHGGPPQPRDVHVPAPMAAEVDRGPYR